MSENLSSTHTLTPEKSWCVYMVLTARNTLYTGIARNAEKRFQEHCDTFQKKPGAKGAKFFRSVQPLKIIYLQYFEDRSAASKREIAIKSMSRKEKVELTATKSEIKN